MYTSILYFCLLSPELQVWLNPLSGVPPFGCNGNWSSNSNLGNTYPMAGNDNTEKITVRSHR